MFKKKDDYRLPSVMQKPQGEVGVVVERGGRQGSHDSDNGDEGDNIIKNNDSNDDN